MLASIRRVVAAGLVLGLMAGGASSARALDLYVNNDLGDDNGNGRTPTFEDGEGSPVRTINRALRLAGRGDRIIIANTGKPYRECLSLSAPWAGGVSVAPMHIEANGATLDGSRPIPSRAWAHFKGEIYRYRPQKLTYPMLFQDGRPVERVLTDAKTTEIPALAPGQWCSFKGDVYFSIDVGKTIEDYALFEPGHDVGITLYRCEHIIISDLVVQGFRLDGINCNEGVFDALLLGITCRGNGRCGLFVGGASKVEVRATVLGDNGQGKETLDSAQLIAQDYSVTVLDDCELLDNTAPAMIKGEHARVEVKAPVDEKDAAPVEKEAFKAIRAQPVAFSKRHWPDEREIRSQPIPFEPMHHGRPAGQCCPQRN